MKNRTVVILDDESFRLTRLSSLFIGSAVNYARTADRAISLIEGTNPDIIFLDNDLDDCFDKYEHKNTGIEVAKFIASLEPNDRPEIVIIHSMNVDAAAEMIKILSSASIQCMACPYDLMDWEKLEIYLSKHFIMP